MKVVVYHKNGASGHEADIINISESESGTLRVERLAVDAKGDLIPQGTYGYARGWWFAYDEIEMPSDDVKARVLDAEKRDDEAEDAKTMRVHTKY